MGHEQSNTEKLPYLFTSKELDEETQLYYFGARYYDPRTSVWQSTDPALSQILERGVSNSVLLSAYTYANQNPVLLHDPDGQHPAIWVILVGAGLMMGEASSSGREDLRGDPVIVAAGATMVGAGALVVRISTATAVPEVATKGPVIGGAAKAGLDRAKNQPAVRETLKRGSRAAEQLSQELEAIGQRAADALRSPAGATPTQRAIERAKGALSRLLQPNGSPIGEVVRRNPRIRTIRGESAGAFFKRLAQESGAVVEKGPRGHPVARIPGGGFAQLRQTSNFGAPTIDLNIRGIDIQKLKFE